MIKHIVCYKLKERSEEVCQKAKTLFLGMPAHIDGLREVRVGIDFLHSERSYDLVLEILFDSQAGLESYRAHPYHTGVVQKYIHTIREHSISVDYVIN